MEYTKEENLAYNIHLIKTKKFKKNCIKINFKSLINNEEITYRNMLINVLLESNMPIIVDAFSVFDKLRYVGFPNESTPVLILKYMITV